MPLDVSVSSLVPPKFPDRCILCGAGEPGRQVRFSAGAKYGVFFFVSWFGKGKGSIVAPACGSCAVGAMGRNLMRFGLSAAGAIVAGWFLFANMKGGRGLFKLKALAVFFAAVLPAVIWDWLFPARFSVTFKDDTREAICHFADAAYAAEFSALNHLKMAEHSQPADEPVDQPAIHSSHFAAGEMAVNESFEDRTNPFRNLEDPRFKKS
jgi:hypothetical protein